MAILNSLRRVMDRKEWEMMTPSPSSTGAGSFVITDPSGEDKAVMLVNGASSIWRYDHNQDGWQQLPNSGIAGSFGAGSCGTFHPYGPTGTATAGTTTTLTTNLTINRSLVGYKIRITGGPGAGNERTIVSNTWGANSVVTVDSAFSATITTSSTYLFLSGRCWFFNAGSSAVGFSYYDRALNTWTSRSVTGLPTAWGTDGRLCMTANIGRDYASGTATSGTATTLVQTDKTWTANQWINYQVRITGGTGAGQVRAITANTANTVTVATWATNPDATSTYVIEGNEDNMYLLGNNAVTMYRYSIAGNSWSTLSPSVARAAAMGAGGGANWVSNVPSTTWSTESVCQNGRYLYSFRGGGSAVMDRYDITTNAWAALTYWPQTETFTTGSCYDYDDDYIMISKEGTGRMFRYIIAENRLVPFSTLIYPNSTTVVGDKMWTKTVTDGGTTLKWVYHILHTSPMLFRCLMIDQ